MTKSNIISLSDPVLGEEEKQVLCSVIDSGWITMGERVLALERAFALLHGAKEAVAVNSCTAALHLCLLIAGVGPGDEVLVPSLTFVATVNAILYCGAKPVFVDLQDPEVPHISIDDAEQSCTPRTKAVIVMHYGGYLMDLPRWRTFADINGLMLIEDAAHAPAVGEVGRLSDAAAFSFFTNKNMTTAEGGMVIVRDDSELGRMRRMRSHGMTSLTLDRYRGHAYSYDVSMLGHNYRMDELRAALGLVQLERLGEFNARRRELTRFYRKRLAEDVPEVSVPFEPDHETAAHLLPVLLPGNADRESVMSALRRAGIQSSVHYPPVHKFSYYRDRFPGNSLSNTEQFFARELTLPLHPGLSKGDVDRVVDALKKALQ